MRRSLLTFFLIGLFVIISAMLYYNLSSPLAMGPEEAKVALKEGKFDAVVDVRTDPEWNLGHYPLAIHNPREGGKDTFLLQYKFPIPRCF